MRTTKPAGSIPDYIKSAPKEVQPILKKIYKIIQSAAPEAVESITYGMPAFKLNKKPLAYFAAFKHHIGLYPPAPKSLTKEVKKYAGPKNNLKFPLDEPIPYVLIKKIIQTRTKEMKE